MEAIFDNPAGRLHAVLTNLKNYTRTHGESVGSAWHQVLGTNDNFSDLLVKLGKVYALPSQIAEAMPNVGGYHRRDVNSWFGPIITGLSAAHPQALWSHVESHFGDEYLEGIESCSIKLSEFYPEPRFNELQLQQTEQLLAKLTQEINTADGITPELKHRLAYSSALKQLEKASSTSG